MNKRLLGVSVTALISLSAILSSCGSFSSPKAAEVLPSSSSVISVSSVPSAAPVLADSFFALLEVNKRLYRYQSGTGDFKAIGNKDEDMLTIGFSPDGRKLLFRYFSGPAQEPVMGIYSPDEGLTLDIPVKNQYGEQFMDASWRNNRQFIVEGHVNPSVEGYVLYDAETGQEINYCGGEFFQVLADERTMLFQLTPHVFPEPTANVAVMLPEGNERIRNLYSTDNPDETIIDAKISPDLRQFAIWKHNTAENRSVLAVADYDTASIKAGPFTGYEIPAEVAGNLLFDKTSSWR
ncbi:hypothetical protein [Gorillibacterium massiliense]|uniref:hypothetical protein n=1 Tax=Gorillibacterium massiliense TaxID=1280390 RepID=UPI0005945028|nr:hypothetical protein [Gorillibacterium massiliense]